MRCKVIKHSGTVVLRYSSTTKNPLDTRVVRVLEQATPAVLLPFSTVQTSSSSSEVHYDISRLITLSEYLKNPISGDLLTILFDQLSQVITACSSLSLPLKNVEFGVNQVYCDPWSNHGLRFIYMPFEGIAPDSDKVRSFFAGIASRAVPIDGRAQQLVMLYGSYFQKEAAFNPTEFASYLTSLASGAGLEPEPRDDEKKSGDGCLSSEIDTRSSKECNCKPQVADCASKEAELRGRHVRLAPNTDVLNRYDWHDFQEVPPQEFVCVPESSSAVQSAPISQPTPEVFASDCVEPFLTTCLDEAGDSPQKSRDSDDSSTTVLPDEVGKKFFLTRVKTGEHFEVQGANFVVGKSVKSSFQVRGTNTVSRSHAVFSCEGESCFIEDDKSTNGTFIDEVQLNSGCRVRLENGVTIRMSDENFTFAICG